MRPCGNTTLYKYAHAVNGNDLAATDRNYKNDSDEEKAWNYYCNSLSSLTPNGIFQYADIRIFRKNTLDYNKLAANTGTGTDVFNKLASKKVPKFETDNNVVTFNMTWTGHFLSNNYSIPVDPEMILNFPKLTNAGAMFFYNTYAGNIKVNFPLVTSADSLCSDNRTMTSWKNPLPNVKHLANSFSIYTTDVGQLTSFEVPLPNVTNGNQVFQNRSELTEIKYPIDEDGNCIHESGKEQATDEEGNLLYNYLTLPKLSTATNMFNNCRLDRPTTISILSSLPAYTSGTHELTMGTHIDNKAEAETEGTELHTLINTTVPNKGWTLTMQYNGTLSTGIATLDLDPIYAKIEENEYGMYKNDETGKCYDLTWGNIIKSPDGKSPIEMGYEECYSIDEIIEKYNLRYIEPEEVKLPPFEEELNNTEQ